ncbi:hypothetical protein BU24DRAFT_344681 [Aaosphaeria arxii CBS 175.79]|uniref:DUF1996 domain-containing protein n=1 Tax=Aaosphaeria arxii CBS 175.79 TaxID=1450172 RepID=A0A6A5XYH2_9PLEO|nr:uncharacterized protein BU24DRAFT_344681 [Aaosphaeria arxii CBS 175.79]KAF2017314.1 hypothetical protein BU24DRAFT_344681 [Aaosphaeria arxii CBS 175.79]
MLWAPYASLALLAPSIHALLRFSCSQLVIERLDPLVNPGEKQSPHVHQIIGGNAFNASMDPTISPSDEATCTTCTFAEDFSNYWTAVLFYRAKNGTFKRVPIKQNVGFESASGGMTVYYTPILQGKAKVTAFKKGFRMIVGNPSYRTEAEAKKFRQLTYTCLQNMNTRTGETLDFPKKACPAGIMVNVRFPTCWDGVNLDSPDHMAHVAYPSSGTFESGGPCPASHPVKLPQLFYEVIFDTTKFNDKSLWPTDGSQPFVWSFGDQTGYGNHGDYVFGWKGDALQKAMDSNCNINCPELKTQSIATGNKCAQAQKVKENLDGWLTELPGGMPVV